MFSFISWTNKVGHWERRRCSRRKAAFTNQPLVGRLFRKDPRQRLRGNPNCPFSVCWCYSASKSVMGGARRDTGMPFQLKPSFPLSTEAQQPSYGCWGCPAWGACLETLQVSSQYTARRFWVSWTPTHTSCRSHSMDPLTESDPLLRDISYQLGRQLLCFHPQTDSSSHPALIKEPPWKLAGQLPTTPALSWRRAVRVVLGRGRLSLGSLEELEEEEGSSREGVGRVSAFISDSVQSHKRSEGRGWLAGRSFVHQDAPGKVI